MEIIVGQNIVGSMKQYVYSNFNVMFISWEMRSRNQILTHSILIVAKSLFSFTYDFITLKQMEFISFLKGIPERRDVDGCEERIWGTKWVQMPPLTKGKGIWLPSFPVYPGLRERSRFPCDKCLLASATGKIFCMPQKTKMFAFPPIQG